MLVAALEEAKQVDDGPVIVHALTTKGKGFPNPEKNYYAYHATGPFDLKTGHAVQIDQSRAADVHAGFRRDDVRADGEGREDRRANSRDARRHRRR